MEADSVYKVAVFDINETILDLAPVRAIVDELLGRDSGFTIWFQRLLHLSLTATITASYEDFSVLARSSLFAVADTVGVELRDDAWGRVAAAMGALDPHPDVLPGLMALREAGWTIIALTNSALASVTTQLERAGIDPLFDHILSVDAVQAFKPVAAPYEYAANIVGVPLADMWMVACHDWDLAGARAAGMSTAYIRRDGMSYASSVLAPDIAVDDFVELAEALLAL